ncbi:MAG: c-type cytochrome [Myxococcales bacterium]|nr:c-type cytochrome [Myxococcales bacterium]
MKRFAFLSLLLVTSACASQPICKPWSPEAAAAAAPASQPPVVDDGTVAVAGAGEDDAWTSVVGEGPRVADSPDGGARRRARPAAAAASPAAPPAAARSAEAPRAPAAPAAPAASAASATTAVAAAPSKPAKPAANPKLSEGRSFFAGRCVPCHGAGGRGDGPAAAALNPKPRNFTDRGWQKSVTDIHIEKVIFQGGPSVGKSPLMPAHADLKDPVMLAAVREVVRAFAR